MATVSLKINIVKSNNVKTMQVSPHHTHTHTHQLSQLSTHIFALHCHLHTPTPSLTHTPPQFEETMIVYDACRLIRERVPDAASGQRE